MTDKEEIRKLFINLILKEMNEDLVTFDFFDENEIFENVKKLASHTGELFSDLEFKGNFLSLANKSIVNGDNYEQKIQTFNMLRNLFTHFPVFDRYEDVYVNEDLLTWNRTGGQIIKYFQKYEDKEICFLVLYKKVNYSWEPKEKINLHVPKLPKSEKLYLKDMLSLREVYLIFCIIKYYLWEMGYSNEKETMISV